MLKIYEVKLENVEYWEEVCNLETNEKVFVKKIGKNLSLYLDRYRKIDGGYNYIDMVSGRVIYTKEDSDFIQLFPSGVIIPKENMTRVKDKLDVISDIVFNNEEEYVQISENVLYYSGLCNMVSEELKLDVIPSNLIKEDVRNVKEYGTKRIRKK